MKKGMILLATSEDDVAYAWWRMVSKGMHQVCLMKAMFDARGDRMELRGAELRLCG